MESSRKRRRAKSGSSWSDLPQQLLRSIAALLINKNNPNDLRHFRGVCRNWRGSTSISALLPHSILPYTRPYQTLFTSTIYLIHRHPSSTSTPWMVCTIEPTKGHLQLLHPFTRIPLQYLPENLNLRQFRHSRLAIGYHLIWANDDGIDDDNYYKRLFSDLDVANKVLFFPSVSHSLPTISDCAILKLCYGGNLFGCSPGDLPSFERLSCGCVDKFDDFVTFRGNMNVLDWQGKMYLVLHGEGLQVLPGFLVKGKKSWCRKNGWRKRLVATSNGELFLIVRVTQLQFKAYKLSRRVWVEVKDFTDQVLFVTRDYGFFVSSTEFPPCHLRNCVVLSNDAFPSYSKTGWEYPTKEDIFVYQLDGNGNNLRPISDFPGFPMMLWSSPPCLFLPDHLREFEEDEEARYLNNQDEDKEVQVDSNSQEEDKEVQGDSNSQERTPDHAYVNDVRNVAEEALDPRTPREGAIHSVSRAYITSLTQSSQSVASTVKFEGLDIRPNLIPTLQKIWSKHGNIMENSIISNGDIVARALESLATTMLILEGNSARSLNDSLASYLSSAMSDLQLVGFNVDWLVPSIDNALALHRSKPLVDSLRGLSRFKVQAFEMRSKLVDELAKLDEYEKELEADISSLSEKIPFLGEVDLDKPLVGEDL